jgi:hypothetical protein
MTDGIEYLGRARLQGVALLVLAFLVGVLAGAAADRLLTRPRPPELRPQETSGAPRLPKVLEDMDLAPAQRAAIDSILASGRPRNEAIMNEVLPRLRAVGDTLHAGIRSVLTPAQAAEFDAYLRSHRPQTPPLPRDGDRRVEDEGRPPRRPPPAGEATDGAPRGPAPRSAPAGERPDRRPPPSGEERDGRRPPPPDGAPPPPRPEG